MPEPVGQATQSGALSGAQKGGQIGQLAGAALGSVIPGLGTAVGSQVGKLAGGGIGALAGGIGARKQAKEAERAQGIALEDPEQRRSLELGRQRLKALQTGSAASTQTELSDIRAQQKAGLSAFAKAGGPGSLSGMMRLGRQAGKRTNEALSRGQREGLFQQNIVNQMQDQISQRKLELGLLNRAQKTFDATQSQSRNLASANAGIATTNPSDVAESVQGAVSGVRGLFSGGGGQPQSSGVPTETGGVTSKTGTVPDLSSITGLL